MLGVRKERGFTLIELIFAMAGFSVMLIVAVSGFLNAVAIYNQANVSRDNQQQVRRTMEQIGAHIRSAKQSTVKPDNNQAVLGIKDGPAGGVVYYKNAAQSVTSNLRTRKVSGSDMLQGCIVYLQTFTVQSGDSVILTSVKSFELNQYLQGEVESQSIRVLIEKSVGTEATPRARQFSNAFKLQSTYFLRGYE